MHLNNVKVKEVLRAYIRYGRTTYLQQYEKTSDKLCRGQLLAMRVKYGLSERSEK
jgi:hypothetical protein